MTLINPHEIEFVSIPTLIGIRVPEIIIPSWFKVVPFLLAFLLSFCIFQRFNSLIIADITDFVNTYR